MRIMVVEDAPEWAILLTESLRQAGHVVDVAENGVQALALAANTTPDVILLDLVLPGMSGLDVCRELRTFSTAHIIMTTGKTEEVDRIVGLTLGADDYITKPYSVPELVARVRAVERRSSTFVPAPDAPRRVGPIELDSSARTVTVHGRRVELTKIEFDLLDAILSRPRIVWTRPAIIDRVWGHDDRPSDLVIDTHIKNLRRKIDEGEGAASLITTVRGVGYRFNQEVLGATAGVAATSAVAAG